MGWLWPLSESESLSGVPEGTHQGAFGSLRKFDMHTGVDLYCEEGALVRAVERGTVVRILQFTGGTESPWWNDTWAVMVEGLTGVVLYGELAQKTLVAVGERVEAGQRIGHVERVLKKSKGLPMDMLHLELYAPGTREPVWWKLDEPKPDCLMDPTGLLLDT